MAYEFYLGVDVPDEADVVTLSLLEKENEDEAGHPEEVEYHVHDLLQVEGDHDERGRVVFDDAAERVKSLIADTPYTGRTIVIVNRSNQHGQQMLDTLQEHGLTALGAVFTDGEGAGQEGGESNFFVAQDTLAEVLGGLDRQRRLTLPQNSKYASSVVNDLESYQSSVDASASGDEEAGEGPIAYSTFTRSTGLACWLGEQHDFDPTEHLADFQPTTGEAKRELRPDTE